MTQKTVTLSEEQWDIVIAELLDANKANRTCLEEDDGWIDVEEAVEMESNIIKRADIVAVLLAQ